MNSFSGSLFSKMLDFTPFSSFEPPPNHPLKDLLDPISVLINTALLRYKEEGSRLTYSKDLKVFIQQPSDYIYLSGVRFLKRQTHKDINIVNAAVERAANLYLPHKAENAEYKLLFKNSSKGLKSLKQTYEKTAKDSEIIAEGIDRLRERISSLANKKENLPSKELSNEEQKIKDLWAKEDIERINGLFVQMEKKQGHTPIETLLCKNEIEQIDLILEQKYQQLIKIWTK